MTAHYQLYRRWPSSYNPNPNSWEVRSAAAHATRESANHMASLLHSVTDAEYEARPVSGDIEPGQRILALNQAGGHIRVEFCSTCSKHVEAGHLSQNRSTTHPETL